MEYVVIVLGLLTILAFAAHIIFKEDSWFGLGCILASSVALLIFVITS